MYVMFYIPLRLFAKIHNIRETILSHLYLIYLHEDEENPADFLGKDQMKGKGQKAQVQMVQMVQTVHMV